MLAKTNLRNVSSKIKITKEHEIFDFGWLKIKTDRKNNIKRNAILWIFENSWPHMLMNYISNHPNLVRWKNIFEPFAGSWAIWLMSLKKWAKQIDFLDINKKAIEYIKQNIEINNFPAWKYKTILEDIKKYKPKHKYNTIFANPPFVPVPKWVSHSLHTWWGTDWNLYNIILINKLSELLLPKWEVFIYTLQIENKKWPIILNNLEDKNRHIECMKMYKTSYSFQKFIESYKKKSPKNRENIDTRAKWLQKKYWEKLTLNSYIIYIKNTGKRTLSIIENDWTKYWKWFFKNIEFYKKFLQYIGN